MVKPKNPRRATAPSIDEIDAMVTALIRAGRWTTLKDTMRMYARPLCVPANQLLLDAMNRTILRGMLEHPESIPSVMADLEAAEEEARESNERQRLRSLDEIVSNLQTAAQKYTPRIH